MSDLVASMVKLEATVNYLDELATYMTATGRTSIASDLTVARNNAQQALAALVP